MIGWIGLKSWSKPQPQILKSVVEVCNLKIRINGLVVLGHQYVGCE